MAASQLVQAGAVESEIWGIGRAPQRTQWADCPTGGRGLFECHGVAACWWWHHTTMRIAPTVLSDFAEPARTAALRPLVSRAQRYCPHEFRWWPGGGAVGGRSTRGQRRFDERRIGASERTRPQL